mgnify:CR=1 FL=1
MGEVKNYKQDEVSDVGAARIKSTRYKLPNSLQLWAGIIKNIKLYKKVT